MGMFKENVFIFPSLRYEILTPNAIPKGFMDGKQACMLMVSSLIEVSMSSSCAWSLFNFPLVSDQKSGAGP